MSINTTLHTGNAAVDRPALQPATARPGLGGFGNMFAKELGDWFGPRRWPLQALLWISILDGFLTFSLFLVPVLVRNAPQTPGQPVPVLPDLLTLGLQTFFPLAGLAGAVAMIVLGQDAILGERQAGTAAWILSKPVARPAFVLAKLAADLIGGAVFILALPGLVAYGELWAAVGHPVAALPFVAGLGLLELVYLFYLTLCLMLGTLFTQRGALLGIAVGLLLGAGLVGALVSQVEQVIPDMLPRVGSILAAGAPLPGTAVLPILATAGWSLVFLGVALWRFGRLEL